MVGGHDIVAYGGDRDGLRHIPVGGRKGQRCARQTGRLWIADRQRYGYGGGRRGRQLHRECGLARRLADRRGPRRCDINRGVIDHHRAQEHTSAIANTLTTPANHRAIGSLPGDRRILLSAGAGLIDQHIAFKRIAIDVELTRPNFPITGLFVGPSDDELVRTVGSDGRCCLLALVQCCDQEFAVPLDTAGVKYLRVDVGRLAADAGVTGPYDHKRTVVQHGDIRVELVQQGSRIDQNFTANLDPRCIKALGVDAVATAILILALPHIHRPPVGRKAHRAAQLILRRCGVYRQLTGHGHAEPAVTTCDDFVAIGAIARPGNDKEQSVIDDTGQVLAERSRLIHPKFAAANAVAAVQAAIDAVARAVLRRVGPHNYKLAA